VFAPSVLFNARAIVLAGVFLRASVFNVRTRSDVHARRFSFGLAIIFPSGHSEGSIIQANACTSFSGDKEKLSHGLRWQNSPAPCRTLLSLVLFRFGDGACLCRTVWRSVLQNNWQLSYAGPRTHQISCRFDICPPAASRRPGRSRTATGKSSRMSISKMSPADVACGRRYC
jgi:hypothetical protein